MAYQVYRACQRGYWRASKRWCKALQPEAVNKALLRFANNEAGLQPVDVYGGPNGAFARLQQLAAWFQVRAFPLPGNPGSCWMLPVEVAACCSTNLLRLGGTFKTACDLQDPYSDTALRFDQSLQKQ